MGVGTKSSKGLYYVYLLTLVSILMLIPNAFEILSFMYILLEYLQYEIEKEKEDSPHDTDCIKEECRGKVERNVFLMSVYMYKDEHV